MSRAFGRLLLVLALASQASGIGAASPMAGAWQVAEIRSLCVLWRDYGHGSKRTTLAIKPSLTGDATRLSIAYPGNEGVGKWSAGRILANDGNDVAVEILDFQAIEKGRRVANISIAPAALKPVLSASRWSIRSQRARNFDLDLDGMDEGLTRLDKCVNEAVRKLGLDPDTQSRIQTRPKENLANIFKSEDYPWISMFFEEQGKTTMKLLIGQDGKVIDCAIAEPSGSAVLDYTSCQVVLMRARFEPARDAAGAPVATATTTSIAWQLSR